jgi:hypothetical protein
VSEFQDPVRPLGKLGCGEGQRQGIQALAAWFAAQAETG